MSALLRFGYCSAFWRPLSSFFFGGGGVTIIISYHTMHKSPMYEAEYYEHIAICLSSSFLILVLARLNSLSKNGYVLDDDGFGVLVRVEGEDMRVSTLA